MSGTVLPSDSPAAPSSAARRQLAVWKRLVFSAIVLLLAMGMVEAALWALGVRTRLHVEDPSHGFSGLVPVFQKQGDRYQTARVGYRTFNEQKFLVQKPAGGIRFFCLGGSSAYGFPRGAESAFTASLGDLLAASHLDRRVEAINAAGISYGVHRLLFVAREVINYQPDFLVIYCGHNEFIEPAFYRDLQDRSRIRNGLEYALCHSRVYSGIHSLAHRQTARRPVDLEMFVRRDRATTYTPQQKREIVIRYGEVLRQIVREAGARGVNVVLATVPCNLSQWKPERSLNSPPLAPSDQAAWLAALTAGKSHLAAGRLDEAAKELEAAAEKSPTHAETHFLLGQVREKQQRWDQARRHFDLACDNDAAPIRRLSAINDEIRAAAAAEGALLVEVDLDFQQRSPHGLIGLNLIEDYVHPTPASHQRIARMIWEAIEQAGWLGPPARADDATFERVMDARSRKKEKVTPVWLFNQATVLLNQGHTGEAIHQLRAAIAIDPGYVMAHVSLGQALRLAGEKEEAIAEYQTALKLDPKEPQTRVRLGEALLDFPARREEATRHFQEALRLDPQCAPARVGLAAVLLDQGKLPEATEHLRQAIAMQDSLVQAHVLLGLALQRAGDTAAAVKQYETAIGLDPDTIGAYLGLGQIRRSQGKSAEAKAAFQTALGIRPETASAHFQLGQIFDFAGDYRSAIAHYREAMRLQPQVLDAAGALAWLRATCPDAHFRNGAEAVTIAQQAAEITQHAEPAVLDVLAAAYAESGQFDQAVATLRKALALLGDDKVPLADELRTRLRAYLERKAWRDLPEGKDAQTR